MRIYHSSKSKTYKYFYKKILTFSFSLTPFEAGKSSFVGFIFIFFPDIWEVKQIDTVECQKLVTVGNYISPRNRLKSFCEEMFLYRDIDSYKDSCVAMCQFLLETLHNNNVSRETGKEKMYSDIQLKPCNGDIDHFWYNFFSCTCQPLNCHPVNLKYASKPL